MQARRPNASVFLMLICEVGRLGLAVQAGRPPAFGEHIHLGLSSPAKGHSPSSVVGCGEACKPPGRVRVFAWCTTCEVGRLRVAVHKLEA
jgi:hypothetical protein